MGPSRPSTAPPTQDELLHLAMQEEMMRSSRQGRGSNPFRKIEMPKMVEVRVYLLCYRVGRLLCALLAPDRQHAHSREEMVDTGIAVVAHFVRTPRGGRERRREGIRAAVRRAAQKTGGRPAGETPAQQAPDWLALL